MKLCRKCKTKKEKKDFFKNKGTLDRLDSYCKKCSLEYRREWYRKNKEKILAYHRKYNKTPIARAYQKQYRQDPKHRLDHNMAHQLWRALKHNKNYRNWSILVGYSRDELAAHLEKQFDNKMSWNNYGSYWTVDHKKARTLFKYPDEKHPEFKKCWALENLQPMEKMANIMKSNRF